MSGDHVFVDRDGKSKQSRERIASVWGEFFGKFPDYRNKFARVESRKETVVTVGNAYWNEKNTHDPAIWTARIENDLVAERRTNYDTDENRDRFGLK